MTSLRHSVARHLDAGVARVAGLVVLAAELDRRRRGVERAAPQHELLVAVLVPGRSLVETLQRAVVPLVEPPVAPHRDPVPVRCVERQVGRGDGAAQHRGVHDGRQNSLVLQQLPTVDGFLATLVVEVDVDPAGEEVLGVPVGVPVAEQDQRVGHADQPSERAGRQPRSGRGRAASGTPRGCAATPRARPASPTPSACS